MKLNHHLKIHPTDKSVGFLLTKTRKVKFRRTVEESWRPYPWQVTCP